MCPGAIAWDMCWVTYPAVWFARKDFANLAIKNSAECGVLYFPLWLSSISSLEWGHINFIAPVLSGM
jgi:hypothetical protein